jgi:hypothetical protein
VDVGTYTHTTVSPKITVYYPFHPLCGCQLKVACKSRKGDRVVTCIDPQGLTIQIPLWMTLPSACEYKISDSLKICPKALLTLAQLLRYSSKNKET